jgi:DNA polymerase-3 subunit epsilon
MCDPGHNRGAICHLPVSHLSTADSWSAGFPTFATKHWACSRADVDWKTEGIRSSALEFIAYSLGFFHDGHRAASDCRATVHALAQPLPGTGRLALQALLEPARQPTWR